MSRAPLNKALAVPDMRSLIIVALALLHAQIAVAATFRVPGLIPDEESAAALVAAQLLFGPNRKTPLELMESGRNTMGGLYANFAWPSATVSDRMRTYTVIYCYSQADAWSCAFVYTQARFFANGTEHRIFLNFDVQTDTVLDLADFIYSPCFSVQYTELTKKAMPLKPVRIQGIHKRGEIFSVSDVGQGYAIARSELSSSGCNFKLLSVHRILY